MKVRGRKSAPVVAPAVPPAPIVLPPPITPPTVLIPPFVFAVLFFVISVLFCLAWWDQFPVVLDLLRAYWKRDSRFLPPAWHGFAGMWFKNAVTMLILLTAETASLVLGRRILRWTHGPLASCSRQVVNVEDLVPFEHVFPLERCSCFDHERADYQPVGHDRLFSEGFKRSNGYQPVLYLQFDLLWQCPGLGCSPRGPWPVSDTKSGDLRMPREPVFRF